MIKFTRHKMKIFACQLFLTACCSNVYADDSINTFYGTVTKVIDGDSIHVKLPGVDRIFVELKDIDAPELQQKWGVESGNFLRNKILGKKVKLDCLLPNELEQCVCVVSLDRIDIGFELLKKGFAWHNTHAETKPHWFQKGTYSFGQELAQTNRSGLWGDPYIAPWEFRKSAE